MAKRSTTKKHIGISAGNYDAYDKQKREKGSIGFNVGPDYGKRGQSLKHYYVTSENWNHHQLTHGMARGIAGIKEAKQFTHKRYPHTWVKFKKNVIARGRPKER